MYKCIYDKTTGRVLAICFSQQDINAIMSNYSNVDVIDINEMPKTLRNFNWHINLTDLTLIKN